MRGERSTQDPIEDEALGLPNFCRRRFVILLGCFSEACTTRAGRGAGGGGQELVILNSLERFWKSYWRAVQAREPFSAADKIGPENWAEI